MARNTDRLTASDINQWIDNDEGLYNWHRSSRQSKREFIRENRADLERIIRAALNRKPAEYRPY
jgi:hypothetical protein